MTYEEALKSGHRKGAVASSDAEVMASVCYGAAQIMCGPGVSPKLIWEGAQKKGMTARELVELWHADPQAAADLMFVE